MFVVEVMWCRSAVFPVPDVGGRAVLLPAVSSRWWCGSGCRWSEVPARPAQTAELQTLLWIPECVWWQTPALLVSTHASPSSLLPLTLHLNLKTPWLQPFQTSQLFHCINQQVVCLICRTDDWSFSGLKRKLFSVIPNMESNTHTHRTVMMWCYVHIVAVKNIVWFHWS